MNPNLFPLPLRVEVLADGSQYPFRLEGLFVFRWRGTTKTGPLDIVVPAGFRTDFASMPRPLRGLLDPSNDVAPAAVVHDFAYTSGMFDDRSNADRMFLDALEANGVPWLRRRLLWAGVRAGGWPSYGRSNQGRADEWLVKGCEAADQWDRQGRESAERLRKAWDAEEAPYRYGNPTSGVVVSRPRGAR